MASSVSKYTLLVLLKGPTEAGDPMYQNIPYVVLIMLLGEMGVG